jgi:hypothetical protein
MYPAIILAIVEDAPSENRMPMKIEMLLKASVLEPGM